MKRMTEEETREAISDFTDKAMDTLAPKVTKAKLWFKRIAAVFFLLLCIPFFLGGLTIAGAVILVIGLLFFAGGFLGMAVEKMAISMIFVLAGIAMAIIGYNAYKKGTASQKWPTTNGTVIHSEVEKRTSTTGSGTNKKKKVTHHARVSYSYSVGGENYTANRVQFGQASGNPHDIVSRYPKGKSITIYYDPETPDQAVLIPGANTMFSMGFMGLGAVFFMLGILSALKVRKNHMALANA